MALIAAHLNAGVILVVTVYIISLFPHLHTLPPILPVPNMPWELSVDVKGQVQG